MTVLVVDASAFITLSAIDYHDLLAELEGAVVVPREVADEITDEPAASHLEGASGSWLTIPDERIREADPDAYRHAAAHLGRDVEEIDLDGDVALLALATAGTETAGGVASTDPVIVTDDRPLRDACTALGIDVSGSIGVLVAAAERDALEPDDAKDALLAMDEVGARLSASLLRRAEGLIDEAANE